MAIEALPQEIAFEIVRQVDYLIQFPLLGVALETRFSTLAGHRQLIVRRKIRVIYDFDELKNRVYILAIQSCHQDLPSPRDLRRKQESE